MNVRRKLVAAAVAAACFHPVGQVTAGNLEDLIPGLYGGDGITLGGGTHQDLFRTSSSDILSELNDTIANEVRPVVITPSAGGVTYQFDPATGSYEQTSDSLGPIVADRPQTLGKGKFSVGFSVTYFEYDQFEGDDLDDLTVTALHDGQENNDPNTITFLDDTINIHVDLQLEYTVLALGGTYGVTDNLDVSAMIPIVDVDMDVKADAVLNLVSGRSDLHAFDDGTNGDAPTDQADDSATGIGDVVLGAKYYWSDFQAFDLAGAVRAKLNTGDEEDFLGTGNPTVMPYLVAGKQFSDKIAGHANLGYDVDLDESDNNAVVYALGIEAGDNRFVGVVDLLGRNETDGDGIGEDVYDISGGLKWRAAKNVIIGGNLIRRLNDDGLRSDLIGTLLLEYRN